MKYTSLAAHFRFFLEKSRRVGKKRRWNAKYLWIFRQKFDKRCKNQQTRKNGNANRLRPTAMRMPVCEAVGSPIAGSRPTADVTIFYNEKFNILTIMIRNRKSKNVRRRKNGRHFFSKPAGEVNLPCRL